MLRRVSLAVFALLIISSLQVRASGIDEKPFDQQSIDELVAKASLAQPREQCFLYAEAVHEMTELSVRQYAAGDEEKSADLLKQIQKLAHKIHLSMSDNNKRLKDAEILLRHTAYRLTGMLHSSSFDDPTLVERTLAQVNQAQNEAMMQVFRK